jgi:hypothetical protein
MSFTPDYPGMSHGVQGESQPFDLPREMELVLDRAAQGELDGTAAHEFATVAPYVLDAITTYDLAAGQLFLASVPSDANAVTIPKSLEQRLQAAGKAWCAQAKDHNKSDSRVYTAPTARGTNAATRATSTVAPVNTSMNFGPGGAPSMPASTADIKQPPLVLRGSEPLSTNDAAPRDARELPRASNLRIIPWLAAAAGIALAAAGWWSPRRPVSPLPGGSGSVAIASPQGGAATNSGALTNGPAAFTTVAAKADAVKLAWSDWSDATVACEKPGVKGELVWADSIQKGVMRFANLPVLDATKEKYQLWIIDSRGMEQRISGGVFNSTAGECYVVIEPGIEVDRAAAFAITIERPGGVWVSDMKRRVVIAAKS